MTAYRTASQVNEAMGRVYFHMMMAVVTSMLVSYWVSSSAGLMQVLFTGWIKWLVIFAPLAAVFVISMAIAANPPRGMAVALLHGFAGIMGISTATVFAAFTTNSVITAFLGAAILFGTMSLWGYFTKQDLHSWGRYLLIGLIAVIVASLVNLFLGSSMMQIVISAVAIVLFLAMTAYDTQNIREQVSVDGNTTAPEILGALSLYINFINIFVSLLQLFGERKE